MANSRPTPCPAAGRRAGYRSEPQGPGGGGGPGPALESWRVLDGPVLRVGLRGEISTWASAFSATALGGCRTRPPPYRPGLLRVGLRWRDRARLGAAPGGKTLQLAAAGATRHRALVRSPVPPRRRVEEYLARVALSVRGHRRRRHGVGTTSAASTPRAARRARVFGDRHLPPPGPRPAGLVVPGDFLALLVLAQQRLAGGRCGAHGGRRTPRLLRSVRWSPRRARPRSRPSSASPRV